MKVVHFADGEITVTTVSGNGLTSEDIGRLVGSRNIYIAAAGATDEEAIAEAVAAGFKDLGKCPPLTAESEKDYHYLELEFPSTGRVLGDFDHRFIL